MPGPYHNPVLSDECLRARVNSRKQGLRSQLASVAVFACDGGHWFPAPRVACGSTVVHGKLHLPEREGLVERPKQERAGLGRS